MLCLGSVNNLNCLEHFVVLIQLFQIAIEIVCHRMRIDIMAAGLRSINDAKLG